MMMVSEKGLSWAVPGDLLMTSSAQHAPVQRRNQIDLGDVDAGTSLQASKLYKFETTTYPPINSQG